MKIRSTALALGLVLSAAAGAASAAQVNGNFQVTATVSGSCVISGANDINFGTYDPTGAQGTSALDAQGSIAVRCTAGSTNVKVALDQGMNADAGSTNETPLRRMVSGSNYLSYQLYQDSGRATVWGDGSAELVIPSFASSITPVTLDTHGRIPAGQNAAIGSYSDTVGVTVTF